MIAMLGGWLAKSVLMQSPVGGVLKRISPKVWLYIAIALAVAGAVVWHQHAAHKALRTADATGYARALKDVAERQKKIDAAAVKLKQKVDARTAKIAQQERTHYDQDVARNHALADALRLRYNAPAGPPRRSGAALPSAARPASAAGGSQPPADAGMAQVPALPLITYAEQCDNDHAARIRVEDAWKRFKLEWPKPLPPTPESS